MSQVYSAASSAVQGVNKYLAAPESENFALKGGRVFSRAIANTALAVASLVETVVYALLSTAALPLCISNRTKGAFNWAYAHTAAAAETTKLAAAGTIGRAQAPADQAVEEAETADAQEPADQAVEEAETADAQEPADQAVEEAETADAQAPADQAVEEAETADAQAPADQAVEEADQVVEETADAQAPADQVKVAKTNTTQVVCAIGATAFAAMVGLGSYYYQDLSKAMEGLGMGNGTAVSTQA